MCLGLTLCVCVPPLPQSETPLDSLRLWQRMYSRHLDQEARQECTITEHLLRRALAGGGEASLPGHWIQSAQ